MTAKPSIAVVRAQQVVKRINDIHIHIHIHILAIIHLNCEAKHMPNGEEWIVVGIASVGTIYCPSLPKSQAILDRAP